MSSELPIMCLCEKCYYIIDPCWWYSIQITPREIWFYCSTACMRADRYRAQITATIEPKGHPNGWR
jgi:hypothetical protein